MPRIPNGAESSSDTEPPDRIHYLLPDGCGDITDLWKKEDGEKLASASTASALSYLHAIWKKHPEASLLPQTLTLPKAVTIEELAGKLRVPIGLLIRAWMGLRPLPQGQELLDTYQGKALMDFELAKKICDVFGVTAVPEDEKGAE